MNTHCPVLNLFNLNNTFNIAFDSIYQACLIFYSWVTMYNLQAKGQSRLRGLVNYDVCICVVQCQWPVIRWRDWTEMNWGPMAGGGRHQVPRQAKPKEPRSRSPLFPKASLQGAPSAPLHRKVQNDIPTIFSDVILTLCCKFCRCFWCD